MRCEICGRGPALEHGGITVYRANEKGVKGIWRCAKHPCEESFRQQAESQWLTNILENKEKESTQ